MVASEPEKDETVLPLAEESAKLEKHSRETGRVRVALRTESVPHEVSETLTSHEFEVSHVPVNRTLEAGEAAPMPRQEADGSWVIPVLEEVLVVERRLVVREEIRLQRHTTEEEIREVVALRRQRAEIERLPPER
ncbi:DUF2382 domain-containing protein [Sabulicella glaciei]|uniref:DUF2382 domain-containing protein n=1 Tax=Sabulicella glaciei TaxID=2984948 RepID=A0ABT3NST0_9PROT|nr:DUF2382 domain-containing protein [Roseococcus sp. MDT2-1-1]MCW8085222.1 DUF2382 domain-containing protein [Roseococcus sp. MDT2-1-1]